MTIKVLPPELARLRILLTPLLGRIADLLPGYRLTLVGRHAEREDGEIILSSDDLPQASAVLARHALLERSKADVAGDSTTSATETTRVEHLAWCKARALEYVERGELSQALALFTSDLGKHPETVRNEAPMAGTRLLLTGRLKTSVEMRSFIESVT